MRLFRATYTDRRGAPREAAKWYVEFRDHLGLRRRLVAFTDKKASAEFGRKIEALVACRLAGERPDGDFGRWLESLPAKICDKLVKTGILSGQRAAANRPLKEHVDDFEQSLVAKGTTQKQARLTANRVRQLIRLCGFVFLSDLVPSVVERALAEMRRGEKNISARTSNFYLGALKQFCRWMEREGRAVGSAVTHMRKLKVEADQRHQRRALTVEELRLILATARNGEEVCGMPGRERALVYQVAVETGLRASELGSLIPTSFDFEASPATVSVGAAQVKSRRASTLPLRPGTAASLREHCRRVLPAARAFRMPKSTHTAEMIRADLKSAGIPYRDDAGRYADFHALRHTFLTNLANSGVHPKTAQALARHSDINLTMSRYTHSLLEEQWEAVQRLPNLDVEEEGRALSTGTNGGPVLGSCLAKQEQFGQTDPDESRLRDGGERQAEKAPRMPEKALSRPLARENGGERGIRTPGPRKGDSGFRNRPVRPLRHLSAVRVRSCRLAPNGRLTAKF
jgi:integrase